MGQNLRATYHWVGFATAENYYRKNSLLLKAVANQASCDEAESESASRAIFLTLSYRIWIS